MGKPPRSSAALALALSAAMLVLAPDRSNAGESAVKSVRKGDSKTFGVIVEKDLFRPTRKKPGTGPGIYTKNDPPPHPKTPPPSITLTGTVLLDTGGVAMLSWQGVSSGSGAYRVGDHIEEFVVTEIRKDMVLLMRGDEVIAAKMSHERQPAQTWKPRERGPSRLGPSSGSPPPVLAGGVPYENPDSREEAEMEKNGESEWNGR